MRVMSLPEASLSQGIGRMAKWESQHGSGLAAGPSVAVQAGRNEIQDTECLRPRNTRVWLFCDTRERSEEPRRRRRRTMRSQRCWASHWRERGAVDEGAALITQYGRVARGACRAACLDLFGCGCLPGAVRFREGRSGMPGWSYYYPPVWSLRLRPFGLGRSPHVRH